MKDDREGAVRQALHLWRGLMETVPTDRLQEAWAIARALQTVYLRYADEGYAVGVAAGKREQRASEEATRLTDGTLRHILVALPFDHIH
jgi:hypothetical protein